MLAQQPQLPHVETLLRSFSIYAVWSHAGLRGLALSEAAGHRLLASSPADCCLYGVDLERFLVSRMTGQRIRDRTTRQLVQVEVPGHVFIYSLDPIRHERVLTLMAVLRGGRYELDISPASASLPSWVPLTAGTSCYADKDTAQRAGNIAHGKAHGARVPPLFTA